MPAPRREAPAQHRRTDDERGIDHGNPEAFLRQEHEAHERPPTPAAAAARRASARRARRQQAGQAGTASSSPYDTHDAIRNSASSAAVYDGPIGHPEVERLPNSQAQPTTPDSRAIACNRLAVVDRLELLRREPRVRGTQALVVALDRRVGGHVAFARRQRMVAGPERDASFRRDQHGAAVRRGSSEPSRARSTSSAPTATATASRQAVASRAATARASSRKNRCAGRVSAASPPTTPASRRAASVTSAGLAVTRQLPSSTRSSTPARWRKRQHDVERLGEHVRRTSTPAADRAPQSRPRCRRASARPPAAPRARRARRPGRPRTDCATLIAGTSVAARRDPRHHRQEERIERRTAEALRLGCSPAARRRR